MWDAGSQYCCWNSDSSLVALSSDHYQAVMVFDVHRKQQVGWSLLPLKHNSNTIAFSVHVLCIACALLVIVCASHVRRMCVLHVDCMSLHVVACALHVHCMFIVCALQVVALHKRLSLTCPTMHCTGNGMVHGTISQNPLEGF